MPKTKTTPVDFKCPACGTVVQIDTLGDPKTCANCGVKVTKIVQLEQLLARWFMPRRWQANLVEPTAAFLIERLWTADGQGVRLFEGVGPHHTNYEIFRHMVTRAIMEGVESGWAELKFPPDPFVDDPRYELNIVDSERFAKVVEGLFPEVNWDEQITTDALPEKPAKKAKKDKS